VALVGVISAEDFQAVFSQGEKANSIAALKMPPSDGGGNKKRIAEEAPPGTGASEPTATSAAPALGSHFLAASGL
jgi:hypothetical protein